MSSAGLELRQSQSITMSQQLRQSIELLQLSTAELEAAIEQEMEKNPLLKREDEAEHLSETTAAASDAPDAPQDTAQDLLSEGGDALDVEESTLWGAQEEPRYQVNRDGAQMQSASGSAGGVEDASLRLCAEQSLHEYLSAQMRQRLHDPLEVKLAEALIDLIDPAGYFPPDLAHRTTQLGIRPDACERLIALIQQCEPTGVGARSLSECLALQLSERGQLDEAMRQLLDHLALVAEGQQRQLCRLCDVTPEELAAMLVRVRACNPKPGDVFGIREPQTLIPEVVVRKGAAGEWIVELNPDTLPRLLIDHDYTARLKRGARDAETKRSISQHLSSANWLLKSLHQRNESLLSVATQIVTFQEDFFEFGIHYLRPMGLKDIAAAAGCHESTVSRITANKYIACARGVFELKYFFGATLTNSNGGEAYSNRTVMHLIRKLVDEEAPNAILSDDAIAALLQRQGIDVARRTIVKYRQKMEIPSSTQRRRLKSL